MIPSQRSARDAILVTDGDQRSALATARSLVAAGYEVVVTASRDRSLAGVSRGVRSVVVHSSPLSDPEAYAREIGEVAAGASACLLIPVTDPSVEALLENRAALPSSALLPFPELATYRMASDKVLMLERAREAGLDVPQSVLVASPSEIESAAVPSLFPAVLKPHHSVVQLPDGSRRKLGVEFARTVEEYRRLAAELPESAFPLLVQHRVRGPGEGMFLLRWNGRIVAQFSHRRLREKPPAGGVSVYRESIEANPMLVAASHRLLDALDWQGVAMVECKRDLRTGRHVFMEVNGRLWGSLQLAIDAGVDFPALLAACAIGESVPPSNPARVGVRSRWFWGDVDHLYLRMSRSAASLHLEADSPSRLAVLRAFLRFWRTGDREEIWRWRDPRPFLLESYRWFFGSAARGG